MAAMETLCNIRHRAFNFIMTTVLTSGACVLNNEYYAYYTEKNCLRIRTLTTMLRKMIELKLSDCTDNVSCFTLSKLPLMLANNNAMLADKNEITRTKTKYTHIHYI